MDFASIAEEYIAYTTETGAFQYQLLLALRLWGVNLNALASSDFDVAVEDRRIAVDESQCCDSHNLRDRAKVEDGLIA